VFNAICSGFQDPPIVCQAIQATVDLSSDLEVGVLYIDDGYKVQHLVGMGLVSTLVLFVILCCYRRAAKRRMKREMKTQIEAAVNHYVTLA
jgi:hypothetical protein